MLLHVWLYDFYGMGYFTESPDGHVINRGSYMSGHLIWNLLNEFG